MIRQHFFPKNTPLKNNKTHRKFAPNAENDPIHSDTPQLAQNYIILDPEITEPIKEDHHNPRRHYSVLRPMQSVALQGKPRSRRRVDDKRFLIDSRRKQICTPVRRELSLVQYSQPRRFSEAENQEPFDIGLHQILKTKPNKHKERLPISMRCKAPSPLDLRAFEVKVRGWETSADDFIDFL